MNTAESKPRLPPGSPCTNCGKCCTNPGFMGTLQASGGDVKRWRRQRHYDILRLADVLGPPDDPWADLWVDDDGRPDSTKCAGALIVHEKPRRPFG